MVLYYSFTLFFRELCIVSLKSWWSKKITFCKSAVGVQARKAKLPQLSAIMLRRGML